MGNHDHVVPPPGGRYQMAVYHQDVEHLFREGSICSQLALAQPGEDVSGGYAAILRTFTCSPQAVRAATAFSGECSITPEGLPRGHGIAGEPTGPPDLGRGVGRRPP